MVAAFDLRGVDYALCGAIALAVHGKPRATTDIDVLVPQEHVDGALTALSAIGYDLRAAPMRFASGIEVHRVSRVEGKELMTIDVLRVTPAVEDAWRGREAHSWDGRTVTVVSRAGLTAMKRLANRAQDRADLEALGEDDDVE